MKSVTQQLLSQHIEADWDNQTEIRQISRDSAPDVDAWIEHAKSIQDDIDRSRRLASSIVRQAEAEDETEETLQEKEQYVEFLTKEVSFNGQLLSALKGIQIIDKILQQAEDLAAKHSIVEALFKLEGRAVFLIPRSAILTVLAAWSAITDLPLEKTTRAVRILDTKCFDQRHHIHDQFTNIWNKLVQVDRDQKTITINKELPGLSTSWYFDVFC